MRPGPSQPDFVGVVVAAGSAKRFGGPTPKQFLELAGCTLLERSVRALASSPAVRGVVVVLSAELLDRPEAAAVRSWPHVLDVVAGGVARCDSVRAGVRAAGETPFVLVHDAARPLASRRLVDAVVEATRRVGAAIPLLGVPDTVKRLGEDGRIAATIDRTGLGLAQTPQGARTDWLLEALAGQAGAEPPVTDESAALEAAGRPVAAVAGEPENVKITAPEDLARARARLEGDSMSLRIGTGFDVHAVDPDRKLILGGVEFEGEPGLRGHSDADVVLHAAMDALLGAAALGDIGALFPPDDPRFEGADSRELAGEVAQRLHEAGYEAVNLDLTLLAERPRVRDRVDEMRGSIAAALRLQPEAIGLKATTLEQLGALGRREGIACQAVALVRKRGAA